MATCVINRIRENSLVESQLVEPILVERQLVEPNEDNKKQKKIRNIKNKIKQIVEEATDIITYERLIAYQNQQAINDFRTCRLEGINARRNDTIVEEMDALTTAYEGGLVVMNKPSWGRATIISFITVLSSTKFVNLLKEGYYMKAAHLLVRTITTSVASISLLSCISCLLSNYCSTCMHSFSMGLIGLGLELLLIIGSYYTMNNCETSGFLDFMSNNGGHFLEVSLKSAFITFCESLPIVLGGLAVSYVCIEYIKHCKERYDNNESWDAILYGSLKDTGEDIIRFFKNIGTVIKGTFIMIKQFLSLDLEDDDKRMIKLLKDDSSNKEILELDIPNAHDCFQCTFDGVIPKDPVFIMGYLCEKEPLLQYLRTPSGRTDEFDNPIFVQRKSFGNTNVVITERDIQYPSERYMDLLGSYIKLRLELIKIKND